MTGHILAFMMLLGNVFQVLASTALALPLLLALTLAVGRRGHGRLCLWGGTKPVSVWQRPSLAACITGFTTVWSSASSQARPRSWPFP